MGENISWYPGHMTKARRMMQENLKLIDLVIELVDARIPVSGRNPDIEELAAGKERLVVLTKADLADPEKTAVYLERFQASGVRAVAVDSRKNSIGSEIAGLVREVCRERIERNKRRGIVGRPMRAMVAGIPNVGKSTFINSVIGRAGAKTGNKPGVTRGKQWLKMGKDLELLDTPGILWPKIEEKETAYRLCLVGSLKDDMMEKETLCAYAVSFLNGMYPGMLENAYGASEPEKMAQVAHLIKSGGEPDMERLYNRLTDDIKNGKIGRVTWDLPDENT